MSKLEVSEEDMLKLAELLSREFELDARRYNRDYNMEGEE